MPELDRETLSAACRAIYNMAHDKFILPPVLGSASSEARPGGPAYRCAVEDVRFSLSVGLAAPSAQGAVIARSNLPLEFRIEARRADGDAVRLSDFDRFQLIQAFLLGVKAPIEAQKRQADSHYKIFLQMSEKFFVYCGELIDRNDDAPAEYICESVGIGLYERSQNFFSSREDGVAVWSARVAQELFGDPKPAAEILWPPITRSTALAVLPPPRREPARWRIPFALAASIILGVGVGVAGFAGEPAGGGEPVQPPASLRVDVGPVVMRHVAAIEPRTPVDVMPATPTPPVSTPADPSYRDVALQPPVADGPPIGPGASPEPQPLIQLAALTPSPASEAPLPPRRPSAAALAAVSTPRAVPGARAAHAARRRPDNPFAFVEQAVSSFAGAIKRMKPAGYQWSSLDPVRASR